MAATSVRPKSRAVLPYVAVFVASYVALTLIVFAIISGLALQASPGLSAAALIGSGMLAAHRFIVDAGRAPQRWEVWRLVLLSFLALLVLSAVMTVVLLLISGVSITDMRLALMELVGKLDAQFVATLAMVTGLLHFIILWFCFGPMAWFLAYLLGKR